MMQTREELIEDHFGLAEEIAKGFRTRLVEYEDRLQEASLALIRVADRYAEVGGGDFGKIARVAITHALLKAVAIVSHRRDRGDSINLDALSDELQATMFDEVWDAIELLPERDQPVMIRLFDMDCTGKQGRKAAAESSGLSEKQVRGVKARSFRRLRHVLSA